MSRLDYQPGDEIHVFSGSAWNDSYTTGTVERITPSGRINVNVSGRTMRFTPLGQEVGRSNGWPLGDFILPKAEAAERAESCKKSMRAARYRHLVRGSLGRMNRLCDRDRAPDLAEELRKLLAYVEKHVQTTEQRP